MLWRAGSYWEIVLCLNWQTFYFCFQRQQKMLQKHWNWIQEMQRLGWEKGIVLFLMCFLFFKPKLLNSFIKFLLPVSLDFDTTFFNYIYKAKIYLVIVIHNNLKKEGLTLFQVFVAFLSIKALWFQKLIENHCRNF